MVTIRHLSGSSGQGAVYCYATSRRQLTCVGDNYTTDVSARCDASCSLVFVTLIFLRVLASQNLGCS
jgi:hypothetical protein